ncbi:lipopolysaccharide-induced tumor necrosis factor-alpha factor homolog isoform X2 [Teleopsis dalmanni]|uniref:lipopolysaccharide-induced tumor necrosis factor-alpha factor homolog isoform X2 n=1 Tax=Teleopsis dalmanni TaxID=139649 RepID=UPI0018CD9A87|nr:lipopolysaccharide-induced tumor necrosis factor-alpha factor homolog isoform X2 [Teleopsis dalmanni]
MPYFSQKKHEQEVLGTELSTFSLNDQLLEDFPTCSQYYSHNISYANSSQIPTLGSRPVTMRCPACSKVITTVIRHKANLQAMLYIMGLFYCCLWPCVCLPYCMDSCQNSNHYCPNCNAYIGTYQS